MKDQIKNSSTPQPTHFPFVKYDQIISYQSGSPANGLLVRESGELSENAEQVRVLSEEEIQQLQDIFALEPDGDAYPSRYSPGYEQALVFSSEGQVVGWINFSFESARVRSHLDDDDRILPVELWSMLEQFFLQLGHTLDDRITRELKVLKESGQVFHSNLISNISFSETICLSLIIPVLQTEYTITLPRTAKVQHLVSEIRRSFDPSGGTVFNLHVKDPPMAIQPYMAPQTLQELGIRQGATLVYHSDTMVSKKDDSAGSTPVMETKEQAVKSAQNEKLTPLKRWLRRPLLMAWYFLLFGLIGVYIALCFWEGFAWSTRIAPTYGLAIIRVLVVIILAIPSFFMLPFTAGSFLLFVLLNGVILFPLLGFVYGLTMSPAGEKRVNEIKTPNNFFFVIGLIVLMVLYGDAILSGETNSLITRYIMDSNVLSIIFGSIAFLWISHNVFHSVKATREGPKPKPLK